MLKDIEEIQTQESALIFEIIYLMRLAQHKRYIRLLFDF